MDVVRSAPHGANHHVILTSIPVGVRAAANPPRMKPGPLAPLTESFEENTRLAVLKIRPTEIRCCFNRSVAGCVVLRTGDQRH